MRLKHVFASAFFGGLVLAVTFWILWTSLDFQECVKSYGQYDPAAEHLEKGSSRIIATLLTYRHCAGAYVVDKNAVITALGTIVIAIFTTVLGVFTISLAGSTRIAANAAARSTKAAIALELPLIRASAAQLGTGGVQETTGARRNVCSVNQLLFYNHGRTRASLIEVQIGLTIGDRLPKEPIYLHKKSFPPNVIMEPNPAVVFEAILHQYDFDAPPDLYDRLRTRSTNLWFYCKLVYLDFMDIRREAGFCWKQYETSGMGALRPDATPAYNRKT
ncbi:MAG: hypothetical protein ACLQDM_22250 [Bradyrhizobium sp.]